MQSEPAITLKRDCDAVMIPSGERVRLSSGSAVWITQTLGGSYTVMTDRGYLARIEGRDGDAIGKPQIGDGAPRKAAVAEALEDITTEVWNQLRSCFDPEIPVNIVDLGLIYGCDVTALGSGEYRVDVRFTLTAQGCGMGQALKGDIERKLSALAGIREVHVELVWDPPWNQTMLSETARQELGIV